MKRSSILNENFIVTSNFAKAVLLKFLQENRCVEAFVNSYNFQRGTSFTCDQILRRCIKTAMLEWDGYLDCVFNFSSISFAWCKCEHIRKVSFWAQINIKWQRLVDRIIISD